MLIRRKGRNIVLGKSNVALIGLFFFFLDFLLHGIFLQGGWLLEEPSRKQYSGGCAQH